MNQSENIDTPNVQYEIADPAVMAIKPLVSVHMLTYNHGPYLAEAIEGVIAQKTDFPVELVIGEDCSTDDTREIALDYQRRYPHLIRVIYSDRNIGIMENYLRVSRSCRGEFVAFCEADDYWISPDKLQVQVAVLLRFTNIDITFHSAYVKYEKQQNKVLSYVLSSTDKVFTLSEVIAGDGNFMPTVSIMVRRSLIMSVQDWLDATMPPLYDYFIQVFASQSGGAYYVNKPMGVYRQEVEGSWSEGTWSEKTKKIDSRVGFERKFLIAVKNLEHDIPRQEEAFKRLIVFHYSALFMTATNETFAKIKELISPVLKDLYESEAIIGYSIGSDRMELEYLLKFAVDSGKAIELADRKRGLYYQILRVAKSLLDYGILLLKMLYTNQSDSSDCEKTMAKWKTELRRSYLIARLMRLYRLIIGNE